MPSAPEGVTTPAPKRLGKPCLTIAGSMIEPIAITVAGEEPDTAANSAQATTPARPRPRYQCRTPGDNAARLPPPPGPGPPYQCPTIEGAKLIMRRAPPPWVRKLPARMKNG